MHRSKPASSIISSARTAILRRRGTARCPEFQRAVHGGWEPPTNSLRTKTRWHELIVDPTIDDDILDRLVHTAHRLALDGDTNHRKNPASVASLTRTPPSERSKPSMGAAGRDHRNAVRDRSESGFRNQSESRNLCPQPPESANMKSLPALSDPSTQIIWWIFLLQGFAGIILGLMLITEPGATMVALTTVLGFYWLIMGVLALVQVFVDRSTPWIWSLLIGIVGILAGLFVLRHPLIAALTVPTVLVIILGIQGLVMGVLEIIGGFKGGGIGPLILGAINVLVGLLLLGSPIAAALAVPLVFGVLLLIQGAGLIILAFRVRA